MIASKRRRLFVELILGSFAIVACCLPATRAHAQTSYYWDSNGTAAGTGDTPNGTWGTSNYWNSDPTGGTAGTFITTTGSADNLYFVVGPAANSGENAFTVTVSGAQYANSLTFQSSGAPTLAGTDPINLWGGGINVSQYAYGTTPQGAVTISAPIALQAAQTWTNSAGSTLTIAGSITNGTNTLTIAGPGNTLISGIISGSGGLTQTGGGTLTLQGTNTYSGPTTISGGTLDLSSGGCLQQSTLVAPTAGSIVFDQSVSSRAFTFGGLGGSGNIGLQTGTGTAVALTVGGNNLSTVYAGGLSGSGSFTKTGSGSLTLTDSNTYTGGTTITGGTLQLGTGMYGFDGSLAGNIADNAALVYDLYGLQSYSGNISGSGSLTKTGIGILTLSGSNIYAGHTTVNLGTLAVTSPLSLPSSGTTSTLTVNSGATLTLNVGTLAWAASNVSSLLTANSGGFNLGSALGIDTTNATSGFSYGSAIAGSMGLTKVGPNTLTLSGTNTYSGPTTVNAGMLTLTSPAALPGYSSSSMLMVNGGTVTLNVGTLAWAASNVSSLLAANGSNFAFGSALGIDTTSATNGFSYGTITGEYGPDEVGHKHLDPHRRQHLFRSDHRPRRHTRSLE